MRIPKHPHIVPLSSIVIDELEGRFVGFTTPYISGGTLDENRSRVFKLEWLRQLTDTVDDLNLKYGIAHHDVASRNLLVDEKTDSLMLFDFNFSGLLGTREHSPERNDVKGVVFAMYEIITGDYSRRAVPHKEQDLAAIENMDEWSKHPDVALDHPVADFRLVLKKWAEKRRLGKQIVEPTDAPEHVYWPTIVEPPTLEYPCQLADGTPSSFKVLRWNKYRPEARETGETILNWQRPPQSAVEEGSILLASGEVVDEVDLKPISE